MRAVAFCSSTFLPLLTHWDPVPTILALCPCPRFSADFTGICILPQSLLMGSAAHLVKLYLCACTFAYIHLLVCSTGCGVCSLDLLLLSASRRISPSKSA